MGIAREQNCRSQSEVLGVILVMAVTIAGVSAVLVLGGAALSDTRSNVQFESAVQSMTEFDSQVSLVAHGEANSQIVEISGSNKGSKRVDSGAGEMTIKIDGVPDVSRTLGAVIYEQDGQTVAYQGGGVWRKQQNGGSTMVSPPEFHYRVKDEGSPTLTLPLVLVDGSDVGEDLRIRKSTSTSQVYPGTNGIENPVEDKQVKVTVESEYYEAWGRFFETRTEGTVTYDHPANKVTIALRAPNNPADVDSPIVGDGAVVNLDNNGRVDGYDSRNGPHSGPMPDELASVRIDADIDTSNSFTVFGEAHATGDANFGNGMEIHESTFIDGDTTINNNPDILGPLHTGGDFDLDANIPMEGDVVVGGNVIDIKTNDQILGDVHVNKDATLTEGEVQDDLVVGGTLNGISNTFTVGGDVHVHGPAELGNLQSVGSNVIAGDSVTVSTDSATIGSGTVHASNSGTVVRIQKDFTGNIEAEGDVEVLGDDGNPTLSGDIVTSGNVLVDGATVDGNVDAGKDVEITGDPSGTETEGEVTGDVTVGGTFTGTDEDVGGTLDETPTSIPEGDPQEPNLPADPEPAVVNVPDKVDSKIGSKGNILQDDDNNDNDDTPCIDDSSDTLQSLPCTLTAGSYYLDSMTVTDELHFDTSSGKIDIYVDGDTHVQADVELTTDAHRVNLYLNGDLTTDNNEALLATDHRASLFWVYMKTTSTADIGQSRIQATIFGPGGSGGSGAEIDISNGAEIWGGVVGDIIHSGGIDVHYDKALADMEADLGGSRVPRVAFLHVSTTAVEVD